MIQLTEITDGDQWSKMAFDPSLDADRLEFAAGDAIFEPLTPARTLFFIQSGQVRTYEASRNASDRMLEILGSGDWLGEAALAQAETYCSRAVAVSPTVIWAAPVRRLMDVLTRQPAAAAELIRQLASKLQAAREDGNHLVFDNCQARLISALLRFSRTAAATSDGDGSIMLHITHRQLAQAVGAARETVSLALTELRQQNLLRTGRNRLMFRPETLKEYAERDCVDAEVVLQK
ncbi:MAG TPA: Crp/Fnr family transcriptional regulator [Tepidisphaeraceae bacterium]|jgi:CRP/FNR family transcriptional regulator|nr:Crp/Fnr family transcriptional regulator [Tepidisphaeraceae bacterium]